ncbi:MAG: hypothetical protein ACPLRM_02650, partial [Anaerolineae bacterium]
MVECIAGIAAAGVSAAAFMHYWANPGISRWQLVAACAANLVAWAFARRRRSKAGEVLAGVGFLVAAGGLAGNEVYRAFWKVVETYGRATKQTRATLDMTRTLLKGGPLGIGLVGIIIAWTYWGGRTSRDPQRPYLPEAKKAPLDVVISPGNGVPVVLKHNDRYTHTLVVGTTGTGKTSRVLKPLIYQDLEALASGRRLGITVIEPKGSFAADVAEMCRDMGIPCTFINPEDPNTAKFNPLDGDDEYAVA